MHTVTLVGFPLASHHLAPSSLRLVDMLLVIMALDDQLLKLDYGGSCKSCPFHVVDANGPTILRLPKCTNLNLVTMIDHEFQHHKL